MTPSSPFRPPQPVSHSKPRAGQSSTSATTTATSSLRRTPSVSPSGCPRSEGAGGSGAGGGGGGKSVAQIKVEKLRREVRELEEGLGGADPDEIVKRHIHLLHLYNERKDATSLLISRLATLEQVPAREIQGRLGIEADD